MEMILRKLILFVTLLVTMSFSVFSYAGVAILENEKGLIIQIDGEIGLPSEYGELYNKIVNARVPINIYLNSPGGYQSGGEVIIAAIQKNQARVTLHINQVYSMAGIITCYVDRVMMTAGSRWMWHAGSMGGIDYTNLPEHEKVLMNTGIERFGQQCIKRGFLTEQELQNTYKGYEVWLAAPEIRDRLFNKTKAHFLFYLNGFVKMWEAYYAKIY